MHRRIKKGTLELSQPEVWRNPFHNHKGKRVTVVVICADSGKDKEERSALPAVTITTLQKSSRLKNLFDQLKLTVNEWRMATEALVSIASRTRVECLATKARADKAFLRDTNEITFNDEEMELGYSDHKRPLYLAASINQISLRDPWLIRALQ